MSYISELVPIRKLMKMAILSSESILTGYIQPTISLIDLETIYISKKIIAYIKVLQRQIYLMSTVALL